MMMLQIIRAEQPTQSKTRVDKLAIGLEVFHKTFSSNHGSMQILLIKTNSMEQSPSETDSHLATQGIPCLYGIPRFITVLDTSLSRHFEAHKKPALTHLNLHVLRTR
jgi:hypothetical protein